MGGRYDPLGSACAPWSPVTYTPHAPAGEATLRARWTLIRLDRQPLIRD